MYMDIKNVEEETPTVTPCITPQADPIHTIPPIGKRTLLLLTQSRARTRQRETSQRRRRGIARSGRQSLGKRRYAPAATPPPPPQTTPTPQASATSDKHASDTTTAW